jgi:prepilin peptidase CpaA
MFAALANVALLTAVAVTVGLALLLGAALHDMAVRTVPNCVAVVLLALGVAARLLSGDLLIGLAVALVVFVAAALLWFRRLMGGGDVKLLGAVALLAPPGRLPELLLMIALCGGVLAVFYLAMSYLVRRPADGPRRTLLGRLAKAEQWRLSRRGPLPYAMAIAGGSIISLSPLMAG